MIVSTDPRDMQRADVIEVRVRGSEFHGLTAEDYAGGTPTTHLQRLARMGSVTRESIELNSSDVVVPASFSGLTIENVGLGDGQSPHPIDMGLSVDWHRCLAFGSYWPEIETAPGVYNFTKLKAALTAAKARGCKTVWNIAYTPYFAGNASYGDSRFKRSAGASTTGWPSPPGDLTATMQGDPRNNSVVTRNFITAAMTEVGDLLDVVITGNEPNYRQANQSNQPNAPCGNFFDNSDTWGGANYTSSRSSVIGDVQRYAQFVRWQACVYATIKALKPAITVLGPDFFGELSSQSTGGKIDGTTAFLQWIADGGAAHCDGYAWHSYSDAYQLTGIAGADWRLAGQLKALDASRAAAGAPAKPWHCTEVGHEGLGNLSLQDQRRWAFQQHLIHASLGWKMVIGYAWDSLNPATDQMSWYLRTPDVVKGFKAGQQPIAAFWNEARNFVAGKTIGAGAVSLPGISRWCGRINGVPYVV